jgi:long-chain acyl-CoA synthetase
MQAGAMSLAALRIDYDAMPRIGDIPRYHARQRGDAVAIRFEGRDTSWAELEARSDRVACALRASGYRPGDRIAFVGNGSVAFFELLFGAARAGVVLVPVQWRLASVEIRSILHDARVRLLFLGPDQLERAAEWAIDGDLQMIAMEGRAEAALRFSEWCEAAPESPVEDRSDPDDVALQLYTSGTTGKPKGVMLSHRNLLRGRSDLMPMRWNQWLEGDVNLVALSLAHIGGVGWAIAGLLNGATTIVLRDFVPAQVLEALSKGGVTRTFLVPTALQILLMLPGVREADFSRLRYILYGASPIALDLLREATVVFGCGFAQQYGMTETSGTIVYLPPEDHDAVGNKRMLSAGLPMPGVELRVVDPQSRRPIGSGHVGEIETRSIANMVGYWNLPAANAATVDGEGWLRTGDAGYLDEDGYLYICDRVDDMICSGGENIHPAEVENAISGHPAVQDVAVIGVPHEKWGEAVKAVVVLRTGAEPDQTSILAHAREWVGGFKIPKTVDFVDTLPRTPSGKVMRRALRDLFSGR